VTGWPSPARRGELLEKEFRKYKLNQRQLLQGDALAELLRKNGLADLDDLYTSLSYGKLTAQAVVSHVVPGQELEEKRDGIVTRAVRRALGRPARGITVRGMDDIMITLAKCCNPVRGEEIVGYISRGKGVSVHSAECPNVATLMYDADRRIEVEWGTAESNGNDRFDVKLLLDVVDQQGLLAKIVSAVSDENTNIKNVDAQTSDTPDAKIQMIVEVADRKQMERVLSRIRRIKGVREVERVLR
jgi:GTP pyrophosphokinase